MDKVTYTPGEFAAVFGKERTWAYRQLYAGKVQAVTGLGRTLIPKSEVERLLKEAGRYLGANVKVKQSPPTAETKRSPLPPAGNSNSGNSWSKSLSTKRNNSIIPAEKTSSGGGEQPVPALGPERPKISSARRDALLRLSGQKLPKSANS